MKFDDNGIVLFSRACFPNTVDDLIGRNVSKGEEEVEELEEADGKYKSTPFWRLLFVDDKSFLPSSLRQGQIEFMREGPFIYLVRTLLPPPMEREEP